MRREESVFRRQHDVKVELTFLGKVFASSARVAADHARAVLGRRLLTARIKGDRDFVVEGFVNSGLMASGRSQETKRAELAMLRQLALKYPVEALSVVLRVLRVRKQP